MRYPTYLTRFDARCIADEAPLPDIDALNRLSANKLCQRVRRQSHTLLTGLRRVKDLRPADVAPLYHEFEAAESLLLADQAPTGIQLLVPVQKPVSRQDTSPEQGVEWIGVLLKVVSDTDRRDGRCWITIYSGTDRGLAIRTGLWPVLTGQACPATDAINRVAEGHFLDQMAQRQRWRQASLQSWHRAADRHTPCDSDG